MWSAAYNKGNYAGTWFGLNDRFEFEKDGKCSNMVSIGVTDM